MNVYEIKSMAKRLSGNTYPGRGIVLGVTPDGRTAVAAYFIMGRSVNSRNRRRYFSNSARSISRW